MLLFYAYGYTKFCTGYTRYTEDKNLTNHLQHKPGVICETDWSGSTMSLIDRMTGEVIDVYLSIDDAECRTTHTLTVAHEP